MNAAAPAVNARTAGATASPQGGTLDRDNPWPGLASYDESARLYFNGRNEEIAELTRRVLDEPLTVLFGRSGLGKSSLLKAGLFPLLREQGFVPVYIRLQLHPQAPPLSAQVRFALQQELRAQSVEAPDWPDDETLWQYLHRCDLEFWNTNNRLVQPVLVFDQFEEVFTLGRRLPAEVDRFRTELADLIENRVPASLYAQLEAAGSKALCLDLKAMPYKIILSLREDFLADLENWRASIPSLRRNRMRLLPMRTANALQAVHNERTAHLVDETQARQIVAFLAARTAGDVDPTRPVAEAKPLPETTDDSEIDPALLSLFCAGVNLRRRRAGKARFDDETIGAAKRTVVADFYRECVADLPPGARAFIEDQLVTEQGYRNSFAVDDALARGYLTENQLDELVNRRLLRRAHLLGTERIELTHDLLTRAVVHERDVRLKAEREAREQREKRRVRLWVAGAAVAIVASLGLSLWFWKLMNEADQQRNEANLQRQQAWSRQLAAMATKEIGRDHQLATWLATQSLSYGETEQSRKAFFDTARYSWPYRKIAGIAKLGGVPKAVAISNSGKHLAVLAEAIDDDADAKPVFVSFWDIDDESAEPNRLWIQRVAIAGAERLALSRDRNAPLVAVGGSSAIEWLDHKAGECVLRLAAAGGVNAMAFGGRNAPFFGWAGEKVNLLARNPAAPGASATETGCAGPTTGAVGVPQDVNTLTVDRAKEIAFARDGSLLLLRRVPSERPSGLGDAFELRRYLRSADGRYSDHEHRQAWVDCAAEASLSLGTNRYSTTKSPATCAFQYSEAGGDFVADDRFDLLDSPEKRWVRNVVWASIGAAHLKVLGDGELEMSGPDAGGRVRVHLRGVDFPAHERFDESLTNELALSGNGQRVAAVGHRDRAVTVYYLEPRPFYAELAHGRFAVAPDAGWVVIETERRWREDDSTLTVFARRPDRDSYEFAGTIRLPSPLKEMAVQHDSLGISVTPNKSPRTQAPANEESDRGRGDQRMLTVDRRSLDAAAAKGEPLAIEQPRTAWGGVGPAKLLIRIAEGRGGDVPSATTGAAATSAGSSRSGGNAAPLSAGVDPGAAEIAEKCGIRAGHNQKLTVLSPSWFALWGDGSIQLFASPCLDFGRYEIAGVSGVGLEGGSTILRIDLDDNKRSMLVPLDRKVTESLGRQLALHDYRDELCRIARIDCDRAGIKNSTAVPR